MNKPVYIVAAHRSALTKAKKGGFSKTRPDDLLAEIIKKTVAIKKPKNNITSKIFILTLNRSSGI